ncbi:hypothetical protein Hanom_Chr11g01033611 [Helianthus anomalus]
MGEVGRDDQENDVQENDVICEAVNSVDNSASVTPSMIAKDKSNSLRKKFKKKNSLRSRVVSPSDNDRPKKRACEDSDYFGLDR